MTTVTTIVNDTPFFRICEAIDTKRNIFISGVGGLRQDILVEATLRALQNQTSMYP